MRLSSGSRLASNDIKYSWRRDFSSRTGQPSELERQSAFATLTVRCMWCQSAVHWRPKPRTLSYSPFHTIPLRLLSSLCITACIHLLVLPKRIVRSERKACLRPPLKRSTMYAHRSNCAKLIRCLFSRWALAVGQTAAEAADVASGGI